MIRESLRGIKRFFASDFYGPTRTDDNLAGWQHLGSIMMVPNQGVQVWATYRQIYLTNPWVWGSVQMLAKGIARLPLHVYQLDAKARKQRVRGDVGMTPGRPTGGQQLDQLLGGRRFNGISKFAVFKRTMIDRLTYGNALWEILRGFGGVTGLRHIPWRNVQRIIEDDQGYALFYEIRDQNDYSIGAKVRHLLPIDVIHFGYGDDPQSVWGSSPLEACRYTLALHDAIFRSLRSYFGNAMQSPGFISIDNLTQKKAAEIRQIISDLYASPENAGKTMVATGQWVKMADGLDVTLIDLVKLSREEIAAAYSVPPPVLGILDHAIKSNVRELREQYTRDSLGPWATDFESELDSQLLSLQPSWANLFVEFQLNELLRPDLETRSLVYQRAAFWASIDEIRGWENLPPLDILGVTDAPWLPRGAQPLQTFENQGAPPAPSEKLTPGQDRPMES